MSVERLLREMIAREVERLISPLVRVVEGQRGEIAKLSILAGSALSRGPGRPPKIELMRSRGANACSVLGCRRPPRSKGFCAAHYQKYRMLEKTRRLPVGWVAHAPPQSIKDVVLPRGRAGAKALAEAKRRR